MNPDSPPQPARSKRTSLSAKTAPAPVRGPLLSAAHLAALDAAEARLREELMIICAAILKGDRHVAAVHPEAASLYSEVWVRMRKDRMNNGRAFSTKKEFLGAFRGTAHEVLKDEAKKRKALKRGGGNEPDCIEKTIQSGKDPAAKPDPAAVAGPDTRQRVQRAEAQLTPRTRRVLRLKYVEGFGDSEIAELTLPDATERRSKDAQRTVVRSKHKKAMEFIRNQIERPERE